MISSGERSKFVLINGNGSSSPSGSTTRTHFIGTGRKPSAPHKLVFEMYFNFFSCLHIHRQQPLSNQDREFQSFP